MHDSLERHTCELKRNQEEAERIVSQMRDQGWEIYSERVPLAGQFGYFCTRLVKQPDGGLTRHAHSVRWNLFGDPLVPITIDCLNDKAFLSFLWQHAGHENFSFFEYQDGDVGFVCYCRGGTCGFSDVLRISDECVPGLSEDALEIVGAYATEND